ncbi:hypothetical protein GBAR_LOCUS28376 [Geodia barretti]|uniref:Uncharacterized protein n=1 Tax=Geodia barretti TaxID=519541 RepID=A0AA35TP49_GEOBA|nr:hypothetical protein GBAR_LOCUS28376 [Geodia barretti]
MSLAKGIKVQPSRFSALNIDSDSDSEVSGVEWLEVVGKGSKSKGKDGAAQAQHREAVSGNRPLSKSAKKRARKKRNQQSESKGAGGEEQDGVERGEGLGSEDQARQERDGVAADLEFQRELEEAILQSKISAEKEQEIERQRKAAFALKKQSKKGVKMSLQSLHRGDLISDSENLKSPQDVELEMKKQPERRVSESLMVSQSSLQSPPGNEGADMVHIVDDITQSPG